MKQENKKHLSVGIAGLVLMALFILFTSPASLPVPMLLLFPVLVFVTSLAWARLILGTFTRYSQLKIKSLSVVISIAPTLLIVLGSLGQLGAQDATLAVLLIGGFGWYLKRVQGLET